MSNTSKQLRFWVDATLECVRRDHTDKISTGDQRGPFLSARALGMGLAALHDGYVSATGGNRLLKFSIATPTSKLDPAIVGAAACHELLLLRFPKQSVLLDAAWDFWVNLFSVENYQIGAGGYDSCKVDASESYGRLIGNAINILGSKDRQLGRALTYKPSGEPYTHDRPPNQPDQGFAGSAWGAADRLITDTRVDFPRPPGRLNANTVIPDAHFAADFLKVQSKGESDPRTRTGDEEVIGIYWGYDGPQQLGTPPRLYMQVVLTILDALKTSNSRGLSEIDELQIIAATGLAMAEAGIDAWYYKYSPEHMMWRPALGIRNDLGNLVKGEPDWLPLGRPDTNRRGVNLTPDFPAYPSGHATFGAASFQLLRIFLVHKGLASFTSEGLDNVSFTFISDEYDGRNTDPRYRQPRPVVPRQYPSLWNAITENSVSRVFLGVHWQFDGVTVKGADPNGDFGIPETPKELGRRGGVWLGCQIANQIAEKIGIPAETIASSIPSHH
jgi:hypothetical protein